MAETCHRLDGSTESHSYWTTVNASEALPGIISPLNWSWYSAPSESGQRTTYQAVGVLPIGVDLNPAEPDARFNDVFFGRYVCNVDSYRRIADRIPGTSGAAFEKQYFGSVRQDVASNRSTGRYPIIAVKFPWAMLTARHRLLRLRAETERFWRKAVADVATADLDRAITILFAAWRMFGKVQAVHFTTSLFAQVSYQSIVNLTPKAGLAGFENSLTTGYGLEETAIQQELWTIAHGEGGSLDHILDTHGFTGPGEIARPSWREDPHPVQELIVRYGQLGADKHPSLIARRQREEREAAERQLLAALPWTARAGAKLVLKLARAYMPLRETGRAGLLAGLDAGRAAAIRIGALLAGRGVIEDPRDIFFLDLDEIARAGEPGALADARAWIRDRKARREYYKTITLPQAWQGVPQPIAAGQPSPAAPVVQPEGPIVVKGIGITDSGATGIARVIRDPSDADDFEPGEILVCPMTDPSWASLFVIAGGVVIDIGGPMSHGAIVAREMGVPCIINTRTGTQQLATGMRVSVDGKAGTATVLAAD